MTENGVDVEETAKIEGYDDSSSKFRQLKVKDVDGQLDDEDFQRILSRPAARRLLSLFEAPEFVQRLRAYNEVDVGSSVTFKAQYHATPTPTVKWFKDEEEVRPTDRHRLDTDHVGGMIRLSISDVITSDEGAYKCKVENRDGVASTTGYLSVTDKSSSRSRASRNGVAGSASGKLQVNGATTTLTTTAAAAATGVSSTSYLGPIAEQKSMEEREEIELMRQPPSPLHQFIDNIRHISGGSSAKARRAPIYYGTGDPHLLCTVRPTSDDASNTNVETTGHRDVMSGDLDDKLTHRRQAASGNRTASDTELGDKNDVTEGQTGVTSSSFQRCRLGQLQKKHRLAIDIQDAVTSPGSGCARCPARQTMALWSVCNTVDSETWQIVITFVVLVSAIGLFLNLPPSWIIPLVAGASITWFRRRDRRQ